MNHFASRKAQENLLFVRTLSSIILVANASSAAQFKAPKQGLNVQKEKS